MRAVEARWARTIRRLAVVGLAACHAPIAPADADATDADEACAPVDTALADDSGEDCAVMVTAPCGLPDGATVSACYPNLSACAEVCTGHDILFCVLAPSSCAADGGAVEGPALVECSGCGAGGRRARGSVVLAGCSRTEIGDFLARLACLERESVRAFDELAAALEALGAPARLASAARRAARDERRHARSMAAAAKRFGGALARPARRTRRPWTLGELLADDAVEGCAYETFGAVVASFQAARATDARLRRSMRAIARDEIRHAALAWSVLAWGWPQLGATDRRRVASRLGAALDALGESGTPSARTREVVGLPEADVAARLAEAVRAVARRELRQLQTVSTRARASARASRVVGRPSVASPSP